MSGKDVVVLGCGDYTVTQWDYTPNVSIFQVCARVIVGVARNRLPAGGL